jgi:hypothetical protein
MSALASTSAELVATRAGPNADPRATQIFSSLIRHLHHFAREVELTNEEWLFACESLIGAGESRFPSAKFVNPAEVLTI